MDTVPGQRKIMLLKHNNNIMHSQPEAFALGEKHWSHHNFHVFLNHDEPYLSATWPHFL